MNDEFINAKEKRYNDHAKFLADIALGVLQGKKEILEVNGVKEIIALYLLIPYITPAKLNTPGENYKIPSISGMFSPEIDYKDLRDSICHSFITVEENKGIPGHGEDLIFDDRVTKKRKTHEDQGIHSECVHVPIKYAHDKLISSFQEIKNQ